MNGSERKWGDIVTGQRQDDTADLKIAIVRDDGDVSYLTYDEIRHTYPPVKAVIVLGRTKYQLTLAAQQLREQGTAVDEPKLHRVKDLIDQLILEAAEALAGYGNYWPQPSEHAQDNERIIENYITEPATFFEDDRIKDVLQWHSDELRAEGQPESEARLSAAMERISVLTQAAREKSGWKKITFLSYGGR